MNNKKFKFPVRTFILVLSLFVLSFSASYAYFSVSTNYDDEATVEKRTTQVTTDKINVNFSTSQVMNNEKMLLIKPEDVSKDADKSVFTVSKLEGKTYNIKYDIYLTNFTISNNLKSEDFKWDLLQDGVSIYSGNFSNAVDGSDYMFTAEPILLTDYSATYELRVWLEETDVNQVELLNGTFGGQVAIDAYTVPNN